MEKPLLLLEKGFVWGIAQGYFQMPSLSQCFYQNSIRIAIQILGVRLTSFILKTIVTKKPTTLVKNP